MSVITSNFLQVQPVASVSNAAASTKMGAVSLKEGGTFSLRMTNGGTAPTVACQCTIMIAHTPAMPALSATPNADWRYHNAYAGSTVASATVEKTIDIAGARHVAFAFANNNQPVTVEVVGTVTESFTST